jgi:hypothetical protein
MTREELIRLVIEITTPKGKTEEKINKLIGVLERNVPHPAVSDLIFYDNLDSRRSS